MKAIYKFSFFLLITILTLSCQREAEDPVPIIQACEYDDSIEELKAWHYFKQGTWWVYRDVNSVDLDTIRVYNSGTGISQDNWPYFFWDSSSSFEEYNFKYYFHESFSRNCNESQDCMCHKVERTKTRPGHFIGSDWCFLFPNLPDLVIGHWPNTSTKLFIQDSLALGDLYFEDVIEWKSNGHPSENYEPVEFYLAKNIGIIRRVLPEQNRDWVLIDYFIQK